MEALGNHRETLVSPWGPLGYPLDPLRIPPIRSITNRMNYIFNDTMVSWQYSMIQLYWQRGERATFGPLSPKASLCRGAKTKGKGKAKGKANGKATGKGKGKGKSKAKGKGQGQSQRPTFLIDELLFSNSLFLQYTLTPLKLRLLEYYRILHIQ